MLILIHIPISCNHLILPALPPHSVKTFHNPAPTIITNYGSIRCKLCICVSIINIVLHFWKVLFGFFC